MIRSAPGFTPYDYDPSLRIYLASSWRNHDQPRVLRLLQDAGYEVYDFRNPAPGVTGFAWRDCGGQAERDHAKSIPSFLGALRSFRAQEGFALDRAALDACDFCVCLLPCGRSAHLEAGYTIGQGKPTLFYLSPDSFEPELMYLLGKACVTTDEELLDALQGAI